MLHSLQSLMWSGHVADNSDTKPVPSKLLRCKKKKKCLRMHGVLNDWINIETVTAERS